jgi:acylphosphatase
MNEANDESQTTEWQRLRAIVHGRVQGVGYRYETVIEAHSLGIVGYVRNRADRTVEVVAEGPTSLLSQFLAWLHRGPPQAHVTRVDVSWQTPLHDIDDFEVRW